MDQGIWNRIGPVCGLLSVAALVWARMAVGATDPGYWPPGDPAETIARHLEGERRILQLGLLVVGLAQIPLVVFVVDVYHRLRRGVDVGAQWLTTLFLAGGLMVIAAWLVHVYTWIGLTNIGDFGQDVQVAKAVNALVMDSLGIIVPGVVVMTVAAAAVSFRFRALPRWSGSVALVALLTAPMYWVPVWLLWVLAASVVLLVNPNAAGVRNEESLTTTAAAPS